MGIAGSQSLGIYTPRPHRKKYDDNANVYSTKFQREDVEPVELCQREDIAKKPNKPGRFARICRSYHLTIFADRIYYFYTFSWLLFAAAFFSATAFIIPFGKEGDFSAITDSELHRSFVALILWLIIWLQTKTTFIAWITLREEISSVRSIWNTVGLPGDMSRILNLVCFQVPTPGRNVRLFLEIGPRRSIALVVAVY